MVSVHQLFCKCDPRLVNFSSALDGASCAQANLLKSWKVVPGTWSQIMKSSLNILQCLRMSLLQVYILDKSSHTSSLFFMSNYSRIFCCEFTFSQCSWFTRVSRGLWYCYKESWGYYHTKWTRKSYSFMEWCHWLCN